MSDKIDTLAMTFVVKPVFVAPSEPGWWLWEVSRVDPTDPAGRRVLMESTSRWRWLAIARALHFAWLSRNNRWTRHIINPSESAS